MKKINIFLCSLTLLIAFALTSCISDLSRDPIDPNMDTPNKVLTSMEAFNQVLAKCYAGLAVSGSDGPDSSPDMEGVDGGFGQYMRALFYMQELTSDEAVIGWNDQTVKDLCYLSWSASDVFVTAMYSRIYYQVSICSEFIRRAQASEFANDPKMVQYIAEARCLRALSYYHAIDIFGNVPFIDENNQIGDLAIQKSRADLFAWLEDEIKGFMDNLPAMGTAEYGRCDQGAAKMILAKLYLNAEVYAGTNRYADCAAICQEITATYPLCDNFFKLFRADNDEEYAKEIIFGVEQDSDNTRSYGGTNFIIFAATGGNMPAAEMGISSGWGGIRITPEAYDNFEGDPRSDFWTEANEAADVEIPQQKEIDDIATFQHGYAVMKYRNVKSDGSAAKATGFVDTDQPVFRTSDAYLMLAECLLRTNGDSNAALAAVNTVRARVGATAWTASDLTLDNILAERCRELLWECHRRSDLIRFGKFTGGEYLWAWKNNTQQGAAVDAKYNLFPIPTSDLNANTNLVQNEGY